MRAVLVMLAIAACGSPKAALTDAGDDDGPGTDGGEPDAPPDTCPVGDWCVETSPVAATLLKSVWAAGLNTVFAVGDNGTILRRRDNAWTAMESPTTQHLRGVWAASPTDAWAVGEAGTILHYDGIAWTSTGTATVDFKSIWGSGPDDVWMCGFGKVIHWNGSIFESQNLTGTLLSISGVGPNDVWVTGESAKVDHFTGTWTTGIDAGGGNSYFAIVAVSSTEVWVSTFTPNMQTRQFDGVSTWTPHSTSGGIFVGFYAAAPDDIWGVGTTTAARWNGSAWTGESPAGNMADLQSVSGIGSSLWVVGSDSLILHHRD